MNIEKLLVEKGIERFTENLKDSSSSLLNLLQRYGIEDISLNFNKDGKWTIDILNKEEISDKIKEVVLQEVINKLSTPSPAYYKEISTSDLKDFIQLLMK
jgi:hypothetical protein